MVDLLIQPVKYKGKVPEPVPLFWDRHPGIRWQGRRDC